MKILLDECVTRKLKKHLTNLEVHTVTELGLSGFKNGKLLAAAEQRGFDVLLTIDKNIDYQQNIGKFNLTLVVFDCFKSNIKYLTPLVPDFLNQLSGFQKGRTYIIS
jgi:hypothetical protein